MMCVYMIACEVHELAHVMAEMCHHIQHSHGFWGSELGPPGLGNMYSYPLSHLLLFIHAKSTIQYT